MRVSLEIQLNDDDLVEAYTGTTNFDDLAASIKARLDEVYCGKHDQPVRTTVTVIGVFIEE